MGLYLVGLIIGRLCASEIWGGLILGGLILFYLFIYLSYFFFLGGGAYYRNFTVAQFTGLSGATLSDVVTQLTVI